MTVVLITGANRGIGFAIAQAISVSLPTSTVVIGSRDISLGEDAVRRLQMGGVATALYTVPLDIENDASIATAANIMEERFGKLDILINNAIRLDTSYPTEMEASREISNSNFNNAVTSNNIVTRTFTALLRKAPWPRVIMISSTRGSIQRTVNRELPPVVSFDYCITKTALNMLTVQLQAAEDGNAESDNKITYWLASPGYCKTGFNGFKGHKDPLECAEVVLRLLKSNRGEIRGGTFWEFEKGHFREVPCSIKKSRKQCNTQNPLQTRGLSYSRAIQAQRHSVQVSKLSVQPGHRQLIRTSTGNHRIGAAYAAQTLSKPLTVVRLETVVPEKLEKIQIYGIDVVLYGSETGLAEQHAQRLAKSQGYTYILPYNDPDVIAGQGTIGLEIMGPCEQVDSIFVSMGGGGLICGIEAVVKPFSPRTKAYGIAATNSKALGDSMAVGRVVETKHQHTLADAMAGDIDVECNEKDIW
ncbi:tryptophan synthase beta subunit-like PLP-dependent enzyme [Xylaria bambusicola]|uniref:tryptophan synthase beta subunit-like PLP-dependent enzyme n=1 Tax=Xylaria bambusicola TaxID=326684 RepID=UPI00200772D4|nr:tryptophan synthase beta subunit-like PLP-dependent enzyme [Xylaria bambusicola]KAI0520717.1 tryptophan synthase beta subunit-like PLP-dependent enzyme [Xylaria bambusicola]